MKEKIKGLIPYIIILVVVIIIRTFVVTPVRVNGTSMFPTLDAGDILILNKLDRSFNRYDIVVLDSSVNGSPIVKRIMGLPGETIEIRNGSLFINGSEIEDDYNNTDTLSFYSDPDMSDMEEIILKEDEYFVLGDNRWASKDSRVFGAINIKDIEGTVGFRIYPFGEFGNIE